MMNYILNLHYKINLLNSYMMSYLHRNFIYILYLSLSSLFWTFVVITLNNFMYYWSSKFYLFILLFLSNNSLDKHLYIFHQLLFHILIFNHKMYIHCNKVIYYYFIYIIQYFLNILQYIIFLMDFINNNIYLKHYSILLYYFNSKHIHHLLFNNRMNNNMFNYMNLHLIQYNIYNYFHYKVLHYILYILLNSNYHNYLLDYLIYK